LARHRPDRRRTAATEHILWAIFLLGGLAGCAFFSWPLFLEGTKSKDWERVPATVIESSVQGGGSSGNYSILIVYEYNYEGVTYRSARWDLLGGSSSAYAPNREVVDAHPPGSEVMAYVNPKDPEKALLKPGLGVLGLFLLIPGVFFLIGLAGFCAKMASVTHGREAEPSPAKRGVDYSTLTFERPEKYRSPSPGQPMALTPSHSRWSLVLFLLFFALFWNGITGTFVALWVSDWRDGSPQWPLAAILSVFVLVGLAILVWLIYQLLALRNPRCKPQVTPAHCALGQPLRLSWELTGDVSRIDRLDFSLECKEINRRSSRRNSSAITHVIFQSELTSIADRSTLRSGHLETRLPDDAMHSFHSVGCRIEWVIRVHGRITGWPDLREEFPLWVDPHPT